MLIELSDLVARHGLKVTGVVHCGAHLGQEADVYQALGIEGVLWIEANPNLWPRLWAKVGPMGHRVLGLDGDGQPTGEATLLAEVSGEVRTLHIAEATNLSNDGQSSSVLPLGTHRDKHPEVHYVADLPLTTTSLFDAIQNGWISSDVPPYDVLPNMLNLDLQGYEGAALAGLGHLVDDVDIIYTEVNVDELYEGCATLDHLDAWMVRHGFELTDVTLAGCQRRDCSDGGNRWVGWGDALYLRADDRYPSFDVPDPSARLFAETHPYLAADWFRP